MRSRQYRSRVGFTLTEMLVVVSIVVLLTALSIPSLIQMGVFSSNKTGNAAREYYEMLRAARTYATTHNVETALVYQGRFVYEMGNDNADANGFSLPTDIVPIIDAYAVCRRLTSAEIEEINGDFLDDGLGDVIPSDAPVFVPVPESNGRFREMPSGTCILPEIFEVEDPGTGPVTTRALSAVYLVDPGLVLPSVEDALREDETGYIRPLLHPLDVTQYLHYELEEDSPLTNLHYQFPSGATATEVHAFPAHRFMPSGEMFPLQTVQRFPARVGMLPDSQPDARFVSYTDDLLLDPTVDPTDTEELSVLFHKSDPAAVTEGDPELVPRFHDPRREIRSGTDEEKFGDEFFFENSVRLNIYTATGRVEILPTVELEDLDDT